MRIETSISTLTILALMTTLCVPGVSSAQPGDELRPKHVNVATLRSVDKGLAFLAKTQGRDGGWHDDRGCASYPVSMAALAGMAFLANGNTPTRGPYADNVRKVSEYLMRFSTPSGLITGPGQENGRPMYGHGFTLMFFACVYGMQTDTRVQQRMGKIIEKAIQLTAEGQSPLGGWTYNPGGGDEGSVTITQIQALRAAHNAGFTVPKGVIENAVKYIEACQNPDGGICYSFSSRGGGSRPAISAAAIATLYNAGEYDSPMADACLDYVVRQFKSGDGRVGHDFYANLYASQAMYFAGNEYWNEYFPKVRDRLVGSQNADGSWNGDHIGKTYGTAIGLVILQLPYRFLPIYQR